MPTEINGQTYYTADEVRESYVPKAEHLERLKAKDLKAAEAADIALRAQRDAATAGERVKALEAQVAEVQTLRSDLRAAHDQAALARAGVSDAALPYLRLAHQQRIDAMPEAERPADADADFRAWLTAAEGGARGHEFVRHYFATMPTPAPAAQPQGQAPSPAPAPGPARAPAPAPPSTVGGAAPPPTSEAQRAAVAQQQAKIDALTSQYVRSPPAQRAQLKPQIEAAQAALQAAVSGQGA